MTWPAVRTGAAVALAFAIPVALAAQVLDGLADIDDNEPVAAALFLAVVAGFLTGGYAAGRRAPARPFVHATVAAVGAYMVVALFALARLAVGGSDIEPIAFVVNAFLTSGLALLGASVAASRNARVGQS